MHAQTLQPPFVRPKPGELAQADHTPTILRNRQNTLIVFQPIRPYRRHVIFPFPDCAGQLHYVGGVFGQGWTAHQSAQSLGALPVERL